jgi:hypothetical protein
MPISSHEMTVAVLQRGLKNLEIVLKKAENHATEAGLEASQLLGARLAHDMYDLAGQAHWAAEGARLGGARLVGTVTSPAPAAPASFVGLYEEIEATIRYLGTLPASELEAGLERDILLDHRGSTVCMPGVRFLLQLVLPGFFFHATAAYAILRHQGVPLTKGDFMGALQ